MATGGLGVVKISALLGAQLKVDIDNPARGFAYGS